MKTKKSEKPPTKKCSTYQYGVCIFLEMPCAKVEARDCPNRVILRGEHELKFDNKDFCMSYNGHQKCESLGWSEGAGGFIDCDCRHRLINDSLSMEDIHDPKNDNLVEMPIRPWFCKEKRFRRLGDVYD